MSFFSSYPRKRVSRAGAYPRPPVRARGKLWTPACAGATIVQNMEAGPMKDFAGKIAVVTGGGSGMGRELVRQLAAQGCSVAACDLNADAMAETAAVAREN